MGIGRLLVLAGLAQLQLRVEGFLAPPSLPAAAAASDSGSSRTRQSPEALPTPFQYEDGRRLRASNGSVAAARRNGCGRGTSSWPLAATGSPGTKGAGAGAGNEAAAAAAAAARVYNVRENIESNSRVASEVYKTLMEPDKKQKAKTAVRKTVSKTPRPKVPGDDDDDGDGSVWMRSRLIEDREELSAEEREEAQDRIAEQAVEDGFLVGPEGKKRLVQPQDYLVHADIGVCRFVGIANVTDSKTGLLQDVIKLEFKETVLEVPLEQSTRLTRFRSRDRKSRLSRYDDYRNWIRKREKAMQKVKRQAGELLTLYKERSVLQRPACRPDGEDSMEFDSKFPFTLTPDQARCVEEIMQDMVWSKRPMDRLLCGDVGFGKTEVAMRAIYRAVRNGRQVAMLAPTTILAAQHYRTLRKRLPDHVSLAYLRSGKSRESDVIKMQMANGTMDVVVGTHSLLTRRISIKNLGLLVVDEEQRFGVHQKETMKAMNQGVDVLTMTATPIPRTLHMSLSGIRDLSTIFSPPEGRQNVTTYVMKSSDEVLVKAITRELKRGGQVFYVCPRIAQIDREYERLATLMPDVRIIVAHSKIGDLDDVVLNFASGAGQVLLSTSVIESGIDMPNVNSIIVRDAYKFGLSSLYQMRGRVGRSDRQAFAYLLYDHKDQLTVDGKRRLMALRELSYLGSGFELAQRDLEIRGCGNIFGTDQSGDVSELGYELYMHMLDEAITRARGAAISPVSLCNVDPMIEERKGSVPPTYIPEEDLPARLSSVRLASGYHELMDIAAEWNTLYGPMPAPTRRLFRYSHLRSACRRLGIDQVAIEPWYDPMLVPLDTDGNEIPRDEIFCARLTGPHLDIDRWRNLMEDHVDFQSRADVQLDGPTSSLLFVSLVKEKRHEWVDRMLAVLLPIVIYVESVK